MAAATEANAPHARFLSLIEVMCPSACRVADGPTPLYTDGDHITATTARTLLAPALADILR